ncbi:flagella basal body P-ring formation protein FlgA [Ketogulonicigenium robustum]|uniref:Flagella basal body P-ring formation protein FlgA n=1 Tax=Ketogulonicigenium robustum TaxID=92947 RepID=A0A1W6P249_9RHOB|nr:flagellar basal body P-ring formation chaperone FlgA [Ketogulonicigenium robustum]ARO15410.1 flagella basal body P-ring formation protein FlgA [Ketogulonicigenium robustum]
MTVLRKIALVTACLASPAAADYVVVLRTIPAQSTIAPEDLALRQGDIPGAITDPSQIIGLEARTPVYAGRPLQASQFGQPAIVQRNQVVPLVFARGAVMITTEGRALERAGAGDLIRVMNLQSRNTVMARIGVEGAAHVSP